MIKTRYKKETKELRAKKPFGFIDSLANLSSIVDHIKHNWVDVSDFRRKISPKLNTKNKGIE